MDAKDEQTHAAVGRPVATEYALRTMEEWLDSDQERLVRQIDLRWSWMDNIGRVCLETDVVTECRDFYDRSDR